MPPIDPNAPYAAFAVDAQSPAAEHHGLGHVAPAGVLIGVFAALMAFTVVTVAVTAVDLGWWNLPLALAIATIKATLVALYFMHLRYDSPFYALLFIGALVFVTLFVSLTLLDSALYQRDIESYQGSAVAVSPE